MKKISVFDVGLVLAKEKQWFPEECIGRKESVRFDDFWKFCIFNDVSVQERKIKELWKGFQITGVAKPVNQYNSLVFDLEKFRVMMATHFPEWRVK